MVNKKKKTFLFLYTELAAYVLACFRALQSENNDIVYVVHWPINKEAPFQFEFPEHVNFISKESQEEEELITWAEEVRPTLIVCSGWIDKTYLKICKRFYGKVPTIMALDNIWQNRPKQLLGSLLSPLFLHKRFSNVWIPGRPQHTYAKKLGFKEDQILWDYYSCDFNFFSQIYTSTRVNKAKALPKRFIYIGRYVENKGIKDLWDAFSSMNNPESEDWELWCLGTGPLENIAPVHPKIKHIGFVQPKDLPNYLAQTGIFVLPSHYEPWGVVVHELATAGFPLICSNNVGAATAYLEENQNGYSFESGNVKALRSALEKIIQKSKKELVEMGECSHKMARQVTPKKWSQTLLNRFQLTEQQ